MNKVGTIRTPVDNIISNMTMHVEVTGIRTWRWRVAVGVLLIRLGAWVIGIKTSVDFRA